MDKTGRLAAVLFFGRSIWISGKEGESVARFRASTPDDLFSACQEMPFAMIR